MCVDGPAQVSGAVVVLCLIAGGTHNDRRTLQFHQFQNTSSDARTLVGSVDCLHHILMGPQKVRNVGFLQDRRGHLIPVHCPLDGSGENGGLQRMSILGGDQVQSSRTCSNSFGKHYLGVGLLSMLLSFGQVRSITPLGPFITTNHDEQPFSIILQFLGPQLQEGGEILLRGRLPGSIELLGHACLPSNGPRLVASFSAGQLLARSLPHPMQGNVSEGQVHGVLQKKRFVE
mmetsp:Transcript_23296/g.35156  ORF Transcript_23296/g.35156 Transcript_23296/m.35156 type:complete len:231 (-) Transcript_23296:291-983(-)